MRELTWRPFISRLASRSMSSSLIVTARFGLFGASLRNVSQIVLRAP
jgi:hypothetical protein